jgi:meso-butanediol dehydrogenase/(S,S)-butanediol dehydrogenase/diacetyl reductase
VRLAGRRALVTGGSSGIGFAIARRLLEEGAEVTITGRDEERLAAARAELGCAAVRADASRPDDVARATAAAGPIDVLVANAGRRGGGRVSEIELDEWEELFATNVRGVYLHARAAFPGMQARGGGCVITIGSDVSLVGDPSIGAYSVSKAAALALTRMLALDGAAAGIRCNCVCPGDIRPEAGERPPWPLPPLGRLGEATDVAGAVAFLASDDAAWITGASFVVDGGMSAGYGTASYGAP